MKSGDDPSKLRQKFRNIRGKAVASGSYVSPVQMLRNMVPESSSTKITKFDCDPSLILRQQDPELFERFTVEARGALNQYNRELTVAIEEDKNDGTWCAFSSERS